MAIYSKVSLCRLLCRCRFFSVWLPRNTFLTSHQAWLKSLGWSACLPAGCLSVWLPAGWLAGWPAGWLAGSLFGWLCGCLFVSLLAGWGWAWLGLAWLAVRFSARYSESLSHRAYVRSNVNASS